MGFAGVSPVRPGSSADIPPLERQDAYTKAGYYNRDQRVEPIPEDSVV